MEETSIRSPVLDEERIRPGHWCGHCPSIVNYIQEGRSDHEETCHLSTKVHCKKKWKKKTEGTGITRFS